MPIACPCEAIGRNLVIEVDFSNHCYSKKFIEGEHRKEEIIVHEAKGRKRVFCPERHGLSLRLPAIIAELPNCKVHQTRQSRNYIYVVPLEIAQQFYEIYFMIQRAEDRPGIDLRITVESAYPVTELSPLPKRPGSIKFQLLARKILRREKIEFSAR